MKSPLRQSFILEEVIPDLTNPDKTHRQDGIYRLLPNQNQLTAIQVVIMHELRKETMYLASGSQNNQVREALIKHGQMYNEVRTHVGQCSLKQRSQNQKNQSVKNHAIKVLKICNKLKLIFRDPDHHSWWCRVKDQSQLLQGQVLFTHHKFKTKTQSVSWRLLANQDIFRLNKYKYPSQKPL